MESESNEIDPNRRRKRDSLNESETHNGDTNEEPSRKVLKTNFGEEIQVPEWLELQIQDPIGCVLVNKSENLDPKRVPVNLVKQLGYKFGWILLRGFEELNSETLERFAALYGNPVVWEYGTCVHLMPDDNPTNTVMSYDELPVHWDVMFPPPSIADKTHYADYTASFQMFQCIKACESQNGGGATTFIDCRKLLNDIDPETK